jgi:hypothetical protein
MLDELLLDCDTRLSELAEMHPEAYVSKIGEDLNVLKGQEKQVELMRRRRDTWM